MRTGVGFRKKGYNVLSLEFILFVLALVIAVILFIQLAFIDPKEETESSMAFKVSNSKTSIAEVEMTTNETLAIANAPFLKSVVANPANPVEISTENLSTDANAETQEDTEIKHFSESTYVKGAILLHGEAGGIPSLTEQSGVLWIVCNRVDSESSFFPDDIESVIEQEGQFDGYIPGETYTEADYELAVDVFERWYREKNGETEVGRTLPKEYLFFLGDGEHNHFTTTQNGLPYKFGSQLISPYIS
jgi:hypothetical protein